MYNKLFAYNCIFAKLYFAGDMLDLLKWRAHPEKIAGCLSKLKEIDGSEIVKVNTIGTVYFSHWDKI